jgi:hypothetical protein
MGIEEVLTAYHSCASHLFVRIAAIGLTVLYRTSVNDAKNHQNLLWLALPGAQYRRELDS